MIYLKKPPTGVEYETMTRRILISLILAGGMASSQEMPAGMTRYVFGFLKSFPNRKNLPEEELNRIQAGHLAHLTKLAGQQVLVAAGPVANGGDIRGIVILKVDSVERAIELEKDDPAVTNQRLVMEFRPWMGPKGIGDPYRAAKAANPSAEDVMRQYQLVVLKKGASWSSVGAAADTIQKEHLAYLGRLMRERKILAAGPFLAEVGDLRGIAVYNVGSAEKARELASQDPAVQAGRLSVEVLDWFAAEGTFPQTVIEVI